jgi:hypothetical protein
VHRHAVPGGMSFLERSEVKRYAAHGVRLLHGAVARAVPALKPAGDRDR